jgi:hypothetical protein
MPPPLSTERGRQGFFREWRKVEILTTKTPRHKERTKEKKEIEGR